MNAQVGSNFHKLISNYANKSRQDFKRSNIMIKGDNKNIEHLSMNVKPSSKISKSLSSQPSQRNQKWSEQTLQKYLSNSPIKDGSK